MHNWLHVLYRCVGLKVFIDEVFFQQEMCGEVSRKYGQGACRPFSREATYHVESFKLPEMLSSQGDLNAGAPLGRGTPAVGCERRRRV